MCDEYNGWKNRETWALNLWLSNDEGLYDEVTERVRDALAANPLPEWATEPDEIKRQNAWTAGEAVRELWDELTDPQEGLIPIDRILTMVADIGSDYRVAWDEIGAAWLEDLDES